MNIKFFIGPMTKNVVDSIIEYCEDKNIMIGFIPSRRQIAIDCGYVNNWSTKTFREYVGDHFIVRDHGGPGQGKADDDGIKSLKEDCKYFNLIHIDPWKKFPDYRDGLSKTIDLIKICYSVNENVLFEVGTEQSIRKFEAEELDNFLTDLQSGLSKDEFENIKYCVIQSGTSLKENHNTGLFDSSRLVKMCGVVKKYGIKSKEHNGDYLPPSLMREKFKLGLDAINIAPEFGQIETKTYMQIIKEKHPDLLNVYWKICYDSGRWKKWVDDSFNPFEQKEELINICGHYVLSNDEFIQNVKNKLGDINALIKINVKIKLKELFHG